MYIAFDGGALDAYGTAGLMAADNATILLDIPRAAGATGAPSPGGGGGGGGGSVSSWGPKRDSLAVVVPVTVLYALIFLLGVVGNISTCVVIARNKHMHTATNYYLFSLAVSDLLLLVSGLPPEMYSIWSRYPYVFGEVFCVLQGFAAETSANATVLTITAFTVERYVAICHPFQSHIVSKLSRAVKFIVAIWLLALCLAVPQAMQLGLVYETDQEGAVLSTEHAVCAIKHTVIKHSFEISSLVFFVAPMTLITALYVLIGVQLRRSSVLAARDAGGSVRMRGQVQPKRAVVVMVNEQPKEECEDADDCRKNFARSAQNKATKHVVKMLVAVVVAFFICWAPFHAQRLLAVYGGETKRPSAVMVVVYTILTYVSGILYYVSTTVNPFLYHIMSHKFREAFKDTLARYLRGRRGRGGRWHCYSVLSGRHNHNSSTTCNHSHASSSASQRSASSLRYLEADMARLQGERRPVVVSFRRPGTSSTSAGGSRATFAGPPPEHEVYVSLEEARGQTTPKRRAALPSVAYRSFVRRHTRCPRPADPSLAKDFELSSSTPKHSSPFDSAYGSGILSTACDLPRSDVVPERETPATYTSFTGGAEDESSLYTLPNSSMENCVQRAILEVDSTGNVSPSTPVITQTYFKRLEDIEIFQEHQLRIQSSVQAMIHVQKDTKVKELQNSIYSSADRCGQTAGGLSSCHDATFTGTVFIPRSSTMPCFGSCKTRPFYKNSYNDSIESASKENVTEKKKCAEYELNNLNFNNDIHECTTEYCTEENSGGVDGGNEAVSRPVTADDPGNTECMTFDNVNNNNEYFAVKLDEISIRSEASDRNNTLRTKNMKFFKASPQEWNISPFCDTSGQKTKEFCFSDCASERKYLKSIPGNEQTDICFTGSANALRVISTQGSCFPDASTKKIHQNFRPKSCLDLRDTYNTSYFIETSQFILSRNIFASSPKLFTHQFPQTLTSTFGK